MRSSLTAHYASLIKGEPHQWLRENQYEVLRHGPSRPIHRATNGICSVPNELLSWRQAKELVLQQNDNRQPTLANRQSPATYCRSSNAIISFHGQNDTFPRVGLPGRAIVECHLARETQTLWCVTSDQVATGSAQHGEICGFDESDKIRRQKNRRRDPCRATSVKETSVGPTADAFPLFRGRTDSTAAAARLFSTIPDIDTWVYIRCPSQISALEPPEGTHDIFNGHQTSLTSRVRLDKGVYYGKGSHCVSEVLPTV